MKINCPTCGQTDSMEKTSVHKFNMILRLIGLLIVAPSCLGIFLGGRLFIQAGQMVGSETAIGVAALTAIFVMGASLVGGLIGWLLLMNKKVFKCSVCGFILNRD